ncbi:P44/Msp2 family outer membrane protein [Anaplasma marginale]|uniref:P44/Msp2 family outer membrane protein n=2 Tax=Anaplasma marginale TaxID=770 RepID=A0A643CPE4_ANAMA|nr:P44/Msp2 family outer membrane protein [Anaplasma marginale]KAB0452229.1 P44/Msp2 family outer membrane protein [Anaplasma marginale]
MCGLHTLPSSVRRWGVFGSVCWIVCMSIRGRACCSILACGALVAASGAVCTGANAGTRGFYATLGGELGVANFGFPSVKTHGVPGAVLGVDKGSGQLVRFAELGLAAPTRDGFGAHYLPKYENSLGLSGALGYSFDSFRLQLSAYSSSFSVDGGSYAVSGNAAWFAFPSGKVSSDGGSTAEYHIGEVSGVGLNSVELSACYSGVGAFGRHFGLYSCLGLGVSSVDYWGSRGSLVLSWSGRTGVEYNLGPRLSLFAEAYYLGTDTEEHAGGGPTLLSTTSSGVPSVDADVLPVLSVGYFGGIAGVRCAFGDGF